MHDIVQNGDSGLVAYDPFDESADAYTSVGSIKHPENCNNCLFWFKGFCKKGICCDFCHFRHDGQKKKYFRMSKRSREQERKKKASAGQPQEDHPEDLQEDHPKDLPPPDEERAAG